MATFTDRNGNKFEINVGDFVGFKNDVEQYGKCVKIDGQWVVIERFDGVTGEKVIVKMHGSNCWTE